MEGGNISPFLGNLLAGLFQTFGHFCWNRVVEQLTRVDFLMDLEIINSYRASRKSLSRYEGTSPCTLENRVRCWVRPTDRQRVVEGVARPSKAVRGHSYLLPSNGQLSTPTATLTTNRRPLFDCVETVLSSPYISLRTIP